MTELSGIQLELELARTKKDQKYFEEVYYKLQQICEDECDMSIEDLTHCLQVATLKVATLANKLKNHCS